jgi:predicted dienelactone hydrolase
MTESLARIPTVVKRVVLDQQMDRFRQLYAIIAYDNPDCGDARAIHRRVRLNGFKAIAAATLLLPGYAQAQARHPVCSIEQTYPTAIAAMQISLDGRIVDVELLMPKRNGNYPLIIFSHGAFSSPDRYRAMLEPLASAGFIIMAPTHIDSEAKEGRNAPPTKTWRTRNAEIAAMIDPPKELKQFLRSEGLRIRHKQRALMGHSYGALNALTLAGAQVRGPDGKQVEPPSKTIRAVISWSPPGAMPSMANDKSWTTISSPSLTITGTADTLPGFIDDWTEHRQNYDHSRTAPKWLWVGEGVDHYFGGMFGRKRAASEQNKALFIRARATTLAFLDQVVRKQKDCLPGEAIVGETFYSSNG